MKITLDFEDGAYEEVRHAAFTAGITVGDFLQKAIGMYLFLLRCHAAGQDILVRVGVFRYHRVDMDAWNAADNE